MAGKAGEDSGRSRGPAGPGHGNECHPIGEAFGDVQASSVGRQDDTVGGVQIPGHHGLPSLQVHEDDGALFGQAVGEVETLAGMKADVVGAVDLQVLAAPPGGPPEGPPLGIEPKHAVPGAVTDQVVSIGQDLVAVGRGGGGPDGGLAAGRHPGNRSPVGYIKVALPVDHRPFRVVFESEHPDGLDGVGMRQSERRHRGPPCNGRMRGSPDEGT